MNSASDVALIACNYLVQALFVLGAWRLVYRRMLRMHPKWWRLLTIAVYVAIVNFVSVTLLARLVPWENTYGLDAGFGAVLVILDVFRIRAHGRRMLMGKAQGNE